jgi:hypothetical protein
MSDTVGAEVAQRPPQSRLQRRSAPEKEMKVLESVFKNWLCLVDVRSVVGPPAPVRRAQSLLRRKRSSIDHRGDVGGSRWKSRVLGSAEALLGGKARSESTVNKSTDRLGPSARAELSSTTSGFKRPRRRRGAGDTTRARVGGFAWVEKRFGIRSGRLLHRTGLRGQRTKGSVAAATARRPVRGRDPESVVWAFTV